MALHRWPTDPPGKAAAHTISWDQHQANLKAKQPAAATTPDLLPTGPAAPQPVDPIYDADIGAITTRRDTTLGNVTGERTRGLAEYGFTETGYDPDKGIAGALAFDPNNPFSRASLLKRNYDTSKASARQSMGSQGQLYSGAFQNQQDLLNRNQLGDEDALTKSLTAFLSDNAGKRTQAHTDFNMGASSALADRAYRAGESPLYSPITPTAPAPAAAAGGVGTAATKTAKIPALTSNTLTAGPNVKSTKTATAKKSKKGKTVTYTTSVKGP